MISALIGILVIIVVGQSASGSSIDLPLIAGAQTFLSCWFGDALQTLRAKRLTRAGAG